MIEVILIIAGCFAFSLAFTLLEPFTKFIWDWYTCKVARKKEQEEQEGPEDNWTTTANLRKIVTLTTIFEVNDIIEELKKSIRVTHFDRPELCYFIEATSRDMEDIERDLKGYKKCPLKVRLSEAAILYKYNPKKFEKDVGTLEYFTKEVLLGITYANRKIRYFYETIEIFRKRFEEDLDWFGSNDLKTWFDEKVPKYEKISMEE